MHSIRRPIFAMMNASTPVILLCVALLLLISGCAPRQTAPPTAPVNADVRPHPYTAPPPPPAAPPTPIVNQTNINIGLLLPLSGEYASLGKATLDAAMLALFDTYESGVIAPNAPRIMLLPKDTGGLADQARSAAREAVQEKSRLILGPVFSKEAEAAIEVAKGANVPIISLSNNRDIASAGAYIFGFMPGQQVYRVIDEAQGRGKQRIAALLPVSEYGNLMHDALTQATALNGQDITRIVRYPENTTDFSDVIRQLRGNNAPGEAGQLFDALLIVEAGDTLMRMIDALKDSRLPMDNITLLGTGQWDDPSLLGNQDMTGSWFASASLQHYAQFSARFEHEYGYTPPRLASLGYDAVALAANLVASNGLNARDMTSVRGFNGTANGIFRLRADGTNERGLSVIELTPQGKSEISPPQRAFY